MAKRHDIITIGQDSREQRGLEKDFAGLDCTVVTNVTIPVFDYCLIVNDALDPFAIERKSINDLVQSLTTTDGQRLEQEKINKIKSQYRANGWPIVYVIEGRAMDILPEQECSCYHVRPAKNCSICHGHDHAFCECLKKRPALDCPFCRGSGIIGYDWTRRKPKPQFAYHQVFVMVMEWGATPLFADSRQGAACFIEGLLRRRWEYLNLWG
jgi:hypothetical protein